MTRLFGPAPAFAACLCRASRSLPALSAAGPQFARRGLVPGHSFSDRSPASWQVGRWKDEDIQAAVRDLQQQVCGYVTGRRQRRAG